jgi:hypothetical protein
VTFDVTRGYSSLKDTQIFINVVSVNNIPQRQCAVVIPYVGSVAAFM